MAGERNFSELLQGQWDQGKFLCVGLDPEWSKVPDSLKFKHQSSSRQRYNATFFLVRDVIDATADYAAAFKPNLAFYEDTDEGLATLDEITDHIRINYPHIPVIGDAKRADIGPTNAGYARMAFGRFDFDAMTTNPYFGHDTYPPLLDKYPGKGLIVLCKTSNPGAALYQDAPVDIINYQTMQSLDGTALSDEEMSLLRDTADQYSKEAEKRIKDAGLAVEFFMGGVVPLYQIIAMRTATLAKQYPNNTFGLVVGATHPEAFIPVRKLAPEQPLLIPGIGSQQGDLAATLRYAPDAKNQGYVINVSGKILFASGGSNYADAARAVAQDYHQKISASRTT